MKFSSISLVLTAALASSSVDAFTPASIRTTSGTCSSSTSCYGYLDQISSKGYEDDGPTDYEKDSYENTKLAEDKKDRFGPGDWSEYVDFGDEFDGGDGQMGVAGDGNKGLEKFGSDVSPSLVKSKMMSAKNAWGTTTGYAEQLINEGVEATRAQQLENWQNQREIQAKRANQRYLTDDFDAAGGETNQWDLAKFGVARNQEFDLDEAFGAVSAGNIDETIQISSRMGQAAVHEFSLKNEYMGFADFRAAFTNDTPPGAFQVEPAEGSLSKEPTNFIVRYRPQAPGAVEGTLVIETEDFKKTYKFIGNTA